MKAPHHKGSADAGFLDVEPVDIELVVVLGVGDRRLQYLPDLVRDATAREGQLGDGLCRVLAADRLRYQVQLPWADADGAQKGRGLGVVEPAFGGWLAQISPLASARSRPPRHVRRARLSPAWP